ncbi:MAG TPA: ABC transporter substrate-binding protein [Candidatus Binatia bacterium]|jgi:NitT/TauT family transport system substrate-binding protein|nr:ABC transporter substrate-binding protein [Candidatus Binatia bacterium]
MARQKLTLAVILIFVTAIATSSHAQSGLKKVRMGSSSTNVSFLALYTALNRGFFKDEGIDLEIVFMPANLASTAVLNGDIDYNGAVTGTIGAAVQGRPMKVLLFTVSKPLLFLMGQKNITDLKQLKGKKIAGSSPGGSATLLANQALKQIGLEPGKDVSVLQMSGNAASRYAVLESGVVDASLLSVPENIIAHEKGYNELLFLGDVVEFPQNGFGTSEKRIRENPDEVYRMVRATLRGLQFIWDKNNSEAVTNILMKQWKVNDRKMAAEMARQVSRVLTKDAYVKPESVQVLVDLARESAKVTKPINAMDVVDYSFLDRARKELGIVK